MFVGNQEKQTMTERKDKNDTKAEWRNESINYVTKEVKPFTAKWKLVNSLTDVQGDQSYCPPLAM